MSWDWEIESFLIVYRFIERVIWLRLIIIEICSWVKCGWWIDLVNDKFYEFLKVKF